MSSFVTHVPSNLIIQRNDILEQGSANGTNKTEHRVDIPASSVSLSPSATCALYAPSTSITNQGREELEIISP